MNCSQSRKGLLRPLRLVPLLMAVAALSAAFTYGSPTLKASVRPCQIVRADGSTQTPRAGRYAIVVRDTSTTRYFSLAGPGVRKSTSARFKGTVRWTLRLKTGLYRFRCGSAKTLRGVLSIR